MNLTNICIRGFGLGFILIGGLAVFGDEVDDYVEAQRQWQHIPGLSLAVVKNGQIVKAKGYGLANVETETPVTPETVFKIGSVSKQFLATAALLLVQEGKISLDDPVSQHLEATPDAWEDIRLRHLMSHTSGLIREVPNFDPFKAQSDAEVLKAVSPFPLRSVPGEKWEYSNVGYYVLAEIIRKVSGKPWSEFVIERLFVPAGMNATRVTTKEIVSHRASGYFARGWNLQNATDWAVLRPSGAFLSTVLDLAKWDSALSSDILLQSTIREQLWTPTVLNNGKTHSYGFGWFVDSARGHRRIRHDGGLPGFSAEFERFIDDGLTVIVLANAENRDLRDVALRIAAFYLPAVLPLDEKPIEDREPEITRQIKSVVSDFADSKLDARLFTEQMASALTQELKAGFAENIRRLGPPRSFDLLERKNEGEDRVYRYRLDYRHVPLFLRCLFNKENKIAKFIIHD